MWKTTCRLAAPVRRREVSALQLVSDHGRSAYCLHLKSLINAPKAPSILSYFILSSSPLLFFFDFLAGSALLCPDRFSLLLGPVICSVHDLNGVSVDIRSRILVRWIIEKRRRSSVLGLDQSGMHVGVRGLLIWLKIYGSIRPICFQLSCAIGLTSYWIPFFHLFWSFYVFTFFFFPFTESLDKKSFCPLSRLIIFQLARHGCAFIPL